MKLSYRLLVILALCAVPLQAQTAFKARRVYTMALEPLADGVVLVRDGKIEAVGSRLAIPPGYTVHEAEVITPGLVDAHTVVGLTGYLNQNHDQEQTENSSPIQPQLRAVDAYNPEDRLVGWVRSFGTTTIHTGHGPGKLISGQTMIVKTAGRTVEEALVRPWAAVACTLGVSARENEGSPGTRAKAAAMLRARLLEAQAYMKRQEKPGKGDPPARDLEKEALAAVLRGEVPLLVTAHRAADLLTALRIAEEFKIRLWLDGAAEVGLVMDQVRQSGFPVIIHPPMQRAFGETENLSMETPARLAAAGVPFALQTGFEGYVPKTRVLLFEAAVAARYGLAPEAALRAATLGAAEILGIADRVGSLEPGKDADLVLFDGDPLEYTSHVVGVFIEGRKVSEGDAEWR
jgi:imidazolonepropionase-like amidohydrolase